MKLREFIILVPILFFQITRLPIVEGKTKDILIPLVKNGDYCNIMFHIGRNHFVTNLLNTQQKENEKESFGNINKYYNMITTYYNMCLLSNI